MRAERSRNVAFDYLTATSMDLMLNRAKDDFEDFWPFPWLRATVSGTAPLIFSDLKYVVLVKEISTNREITGIDIRQLGQDGTDLNLLGEPIHWYLSESPTDRVTMSLWPVAATDLSVIYVRQTPILDDDTDTPLIPSRYHSIWIDWAVIQAYRDSDNFSTASALEAATVARMQGVVERYETRNRQNSRVMSIRSGGEDE